MNKLIDAIIDNYRVNGFCENYKNIDDEIYVYYDNLIGVVDFEEDYRSITIEDKKDLGEIVLEYFKDDLWEKYEFELTKNQEELLLEKIINNQTLPNLDANLGKLLDNEKLFYKLQDKLPEKNITEKKTKI